jgi:septal ring factor EnvC (AmiA/AmiB activator)
LDIRFTYEIVKETAARMSSPNEILDLYDHFVSSISETIAKCDASTEEMETLKADLEKATKSNSELMTQLKKKDDEIAYMTKQVGIMTTDAKGALTKLAAEANAQKAVLKLQYEVCTKSVPNHNFTICHATMLYIIRLTLDKRDSIQFEVNRARTSRPTVRKRAT